MAHNPNLAAYQGSWIHTLLYEAVAARKMLQRAWSPETAYQGITLAPGDPPSRGQCGVSSLWLARHLRRHGVEAYFVEGLIHLDNLGEEFVWVEARRPGMAALAIDLTSRQFCSPNKNDVHVGAYDCDHGMIGVYEPQQYFEPYDVSRKKLLARYAILEANIAGLPRRHRKISRR